MVWEIKEMVKKMPSGISSHRLLPILIFCHSFTYSVNIFINKGPSLNFVSNKLNFLHSSCTPWLSFRHDPDLQNRASTKLLICPINSPISVFESNMKHHSHSSNSLLTLSMTRNSESWNPLSPGRFGQRRTRDPSQKVNASSQVDALRASVEQNDSIKPPLSAFNHALRACAQDEGGLQLAEQVVSLMKQANVSGNQQSFNILLRCVADSSEQRGEAAFLQGLEIFNVGSPPSLSFLFRRLSAFLFPFLLLDFPLDTLPACRSV
jgi:hypothetical protein